MQAVINAAPTPIFYKDVDGRYLGCNKAFEDYIGLSREQLIGKNAFELFDKELAEVYFQADKKLIESKDTQIYEANVAYADGSIHDVMFHKAYFRVEEDNLEGIVGAILDITERKKAESSLKKIALTDSLTGLDNRYSLFKSLEHSLLQQKRKNSTLAFLMLDLDKFKDINDTYGHITGDKLLVEVANRLRQCLRESDIIARFGGDEFSLILEHISTQDVKNVAEKILKEFNKPMKVNQHDIQAGISIGVAMSASSHSSEQMVKLADNALYKAKEKGRGRYEINKFS